MIGVNLSLFTEIGSIYVVDTLLVSSQLVSVWLKLATTLASAEAGIGLKSA